MSDTDDIEEVIERLSLYGHTGARTGLRDDILALVSHALNLEVEAREKNAWEGRYNALLEECEASRARPYKGNGLDLTEGTLVIDKDGDVWRRDDRNVWWSTAQSDSLALDDTWAPYFIIYMPKGES
jgi:hypothetical protein